MSEPTDQAATRVQRPYPGLEIDEDLARERRDWRIERVGWALMVSVAAATLLGLFGRGPLSRAAATAPDGRLQVEYERFARVRAPTTLRVWVAPSPRPDVERRDAAGDAAGDSPDDARALTRGDTVPIWLDRRYVEHAEVVRLVPEPVEVIALDEWVVYRFRRVDARGALTITLDLEPERFGRATGRVALGGPLDGARQDAMSPTGTAPAGGVRFTQLIYP